MNPLDAVKTLKRIVGNGLRTRSAKIAVNSAPLVFSALPTGEASYQAALYFSDEMVNAYQIRQWLRSDAPIGRACPHRCLGP